MFYLGHLGIPFAFYEMYKFGFGWTLLKLYLISSIYEIFGGFGITAGAHRLWSHRSYQANIIFRTILMLLNCIAYQGELFYWCRDHRAHHKHSDTKGDPHNATRGFWFSHMGWLLQSRDPECEQALREVPVKDLLEDPVISFQLEYYPYLVFLFRVVVPFCIGYSITGSWRLAFFFNVCELWCHSLHHTFLVNSAAHLPLCGYRPYNEEILPTEAPLVIVAALGEGHHNFHHMFPEDYATSEFGWSDSFNPTKAFIDFGAWLGWVTERTRSVRDTKELTTGKQKWKKQKLVGFMNKDD